jgi:hypothetical protein
MAADGSVSCIPGSARARTIGVDESTTGAHRADSEASSHDHINNRRGNKDRA